MTSDRQQTLARSDVIAGLRELLAELHATSTTARIRIIGGAAIALTVHADRPATVDIDAPIEPAEPVLEAARRVANRNGWRQDWINDAATVFLPSGYGDRAVSWNTVYSDGQVLVQVAAPEALLAMKLHAAQTRGNRDAYDLAVLLPHCQVTTAAEAEWIYEAYYPGDSFTSRTAELIQRILATNPSAPTAPPFPDLS